jgi:hypothetical protein
MILAARINSGTANNRNESTPSNILSTTIDKGTFMVNMIVIRVDTPKAKASGIPTVDKKANSDKTSNKVIFTPPFKLL